MERLGQKRRVSARDISKVEAKGFGERWDVGDREKDPEVATLGSHVIETTWDGRRVGENTNARHSCTCRQVRRFLNCMCIEQQLDVDGVSDVGPEWRHGDR